MKWKAHAKLNLALNITGVRPDGYHTIDTIVQEITPADELEIEPADTIEIECPGIPLEDNTALRAASLFFEKADIHGGARIYIDKKIPVGAGLGGGSSDAAAVLCALNHMYGHPLSRSELLNTAVQIGADAPMFINGGTQRAQGIGDVLTRLPNRISFLFLLVKPKQSIATEQAYALYDELPRRSVPIDLVASALQCSDRTLFREYAGNALLPAAEKLVPSIPVIGQRCLDAGATFWMLTGSGSCIYSIFRDRETREAARAALSREYPYVVCADACDRALRDPVDGR